MLVTWPISWVAWAWPHRRNVARCVRDRKCWHFTSTLPILIALVLYRLTPSNTGETPDHCTRCDQLFEKAKHKSMATNPTLPPSSAKIRKILEILDEIESRGEGEKTIIFSQFTSMLDIIQPFLKANSIKFVRCKEIFQPPCWIAHNRPYRRWLYD